MYKDKEAQKESNRIANQRYRDKKAGIAQKPVIEPKNSIQDEPGHVIPVIPDTNDTLNRDTHVIPDYGQADCQCLHCQNIHKINPGARLNHSKYMSRAELDKAGYNFNRVSLPGDVDYDGCMIKDDNGVWRQKQA